MSREIDASDLSSLDVEDLKYLHDRNQISTAEFAEAVGVSEAELKGQLQDATAGAALDLEDRANTGTANTAGVTAEEYEQRLKVNNGLTDEDDESDDEDEEEEEEETSYSDMTNDQLRAELSSRGLPIAGKQAELIQRLEEDDASEEEEEEEEQE